MDWTLNKDRAICPQICERICLGIVTGEFVPETRLLSVRDVALAAGVNPNTVQRAFETLEGDGVLYSVRGSGWYVGKETYLARERYLAVLAEKTRRYFDEMHALGLSDERIKNYVKEWKENE